MNKRFTLETGFRANRVEVSLYSGPIELVLQRHINDWALSLTFWTPAAIMLTIGPFSVSFGWNNLFSFYGPGIGYMPKTRTWYVHLTDGLWRDRARLL